MMVRGSVVCGAKIQQAPDEYDIPARHAAGRAITGC